MEELLGDDGADGTVGTQLKAVGTAITAIETLIEAGTKVGQPTDLDTAAKYTELTNAVTAANKAIDEKLESGDLTQLDTSNLKALRSSINDIQNQIENTFEDLNLKAGVSNPKVDAAKAKELKEAFKTVVASNTELGEKAVGVATSSQKQAEITSSKLAMEELLGKDGKAGAVGAELTKITTALTGADGIKKLVDDAATAQAPATLNVKAKFDELTAAVGEANKVIDEKLESGDLTQLDTSNLKALKSSINDIQSQIQSAFDDFGLSTSTANNTVPQAKAKELLAALEGGAIKSNTELGEKAGGVATLSQKQASY